MQAREGRVRRGLDWSSLALVAGLVLAACGAPEELDTLNAEIDGESLSTTEQHFETPQLGRINLMTSAKAPIFIRTSFPRPMPNSQRAELNRLVHNAVLAWLAAVRSMPGGEAITTQVFVGEDLHGALSVDFLDEHGRSNYKGCINRSCAIPIIKIYRDDYNYATILHEFGHAFALGDLYVEGIWNCKEGQYPVSTMCGNSTSLTADDIRAIRYVYCYHNPHACSTEHWKDMYGHWRDMWGTPAVFGNPGTFVCSSSRKLSSFTVRSGAHIDSIRVNCSGGESKLFGGSGGTRTETTSCPNGTTMRGVQIRSLNFHWELIQRVHSVQPFCSNGTFGARIGSGGDEFSTLYLCPDQYPEVRGIRVRADAYINQLGLVCGTSSGSLVTNWFTPPPPPPRDPPPRDPPPRDPPERCGTKSEASPHLRKCP